MKKVHRIHVDTPNKMVILSLQRVFWCCKCHAGPLETDENGEVIDDLNMCDDCHRLDYYGPEEMRRHREVWGDPIL
jgi:hypothetical protein